MRASSNGDRAVRVLFTWGGATGASILPFFVLLLRDRGFAVDQIGIVVAISSFTSVAATPVWSHVADRQLGSVRALELAAISSAIVALALARTGANLTLTIVVAGVLGVAQAPIAGLADALALTHLGVERERDYGSIRLWASFGWALAVIAFGALFELEGFGLLLPLYAGMAVIYAALVSRMAQTPPERTDRHPSKLGSLGEAFRASSALPAFVAGLFLIAVASSAVITFVPLRISSRGGGPFLIGLAAGIAATIEIPFFRASGRLVDRFGVRTLYVIGVAIFMTLMVFAALVSGPVAASVFRALSGAGFGLMYPSLVVIAGRLLPTHLRNTGQGIVQTTGNGIAPIVGGAVGGLVYEHLGAGALFLGAAACTAFGTLIVWAALSGAAFTRSRAAG